MAAALLGVSAPVLLFPELIPASVQSPLVPTLTLLALAVAGLLVHPWPRVRWAFWGFAAIIAYSWWTVPMPDDRGLRHFSGIGLHLLVAAVVGRWCTTLQRLIAVTATLVVGSTLVLVLGLLTTTISTAKFSDPSATSVGSTELASPRFTLKLSGLDGGAVNPNALGGTAAMVLPVCCGLLAAGWISRTRWHGRRFVGGVGAAVAASAVLFSFSRMAWLATLLPLVVLGLSARRSRQITAGLILVAGGVLFVALRLAPSAAVNATMQTSLLRAAIWRDAVDKIREAPWFGIGINQFHKLPFTSEQIGPTVVPHAHNIVLQMALDLGVTGATVYLVLMAAVLALAARVSRGGGVLGAVTAGAGLSLVAAHTFGIGDAIAMGAKVGIVQWVCVGLVLAASRLPPTVDAAAR